MTNLHLTTGEQDALKQDAKKCGIEHCDILDRERLRIELDTPGGFFIRFQHLSITLSEAEQASFLSKYGNQIQEVVTTGFQKVEKTLNRLLFLNESSDALDTLTFRFVLKRGYAGSEIGHFRAFVFLSLRDARPDMFILWFGSSDRSDRFRDDIKNAECDMTPGVANGLSSGQWERYLGPRPDEQSDTETELEQDVKADIRELDYHQTSWSSGIGMDPVPGVIAQYRNGVRSPDRRPRFSVREFDAGMYLPFLNASLAEKLHSIQIFANGYKLEDYGPDDFQIDRSACADGLPGNFTEEELQDPWVRIRPGRGSSAYQFRFNRTTPKRILGHEETADSPPPPELV